MNNKYGNSFLAQFGFAYFRNSVNDEQYDCWDKSVRLAPTVSEALGDFHEGHETSPKTPTGVMEPGY